MDDDSPDGIGKLADTMAEQHKDKLLVLHRQAKQGLGRAYVHAFQHLLTLPYDFIIHMDADLSQDPAPIQEMIATLGGADVVVGSRYINCINVVGWDFKRLLLSKFATFYIRTITELQLSDATSGFRCWTTHALRELGLDHLSAQDI